MSQIKRKAETVDLAQSQTAPFPELRQTLAHGLPDETKFGEVCDEICATVQRDPHAASEYLSYTVMYPRTRRRDGRWKPAFVRQKPILPLFIACAVRAPRDVVELVYHAHPDAIREKEEGSGATALHFACEHGASADVIEFLIEKHPDSLDSPGKFGQIPLYDAPTAVLPLMVRKRPHSIWAESMLHSPPVAELFYRLSATEIQSLIQFFAAEHPEILQKRNRKHQRTLLHWACRCRASPDIIESLVGETPKALREEDRRGDTPLHCCVRNTWQNAPDLAAIRRLLSADPALAAKTNHIGATPLSLLCDESHPDDESGDEIEDEEEDAEEQDWREGAPLRDIAHLFLRASHYGAVADPLPPFTPGGPSREFRPLHAACASGCPPNLFEPILSAHADQASVRDEEGNTALGLSLRRLATTATTGGNGRVLDFIDDQYDGRYEAIDHCKRLIEVCPEVGGEADPSGRLPLHVALGICQDWRWSEFIIRYLVPAAPDTVGRCDPCTRLFPFQLAAVHEFDVDIVYELLRRFPDLVAPR